MCVQRFASRKVAVALPHTLNLRTCFAGDAGDFEARSASRGAPTRAVGREELGGRRGDVSPSRKRRDQVLTTSERPAQQVRLSRTDRLGPCMPTVPRLKLAVVRSVPPQSSGRSPGASVEAQSP